MCGFIWALCYGWVGRGREGESLLWQQSLESFQICPVESRSTKAFWTKPSLSAFDIELFVFGPQWGLQGEKSFGHHAVLNLSSLFGSCMLVSRVCLTAPAALLWLSQWQYGWVQSELPRPTFLLDKYPLVNMLKSKRACWFGCTCMVCIGRVISPGVSPLQRCCCTTSYRLVLKHWSWDAIQCSFLIVVAVLKF